MNPFFSVIIIYFNSEKYVDQSVSSVLRQTYHDFELLLIDDGSTDQTPILCEKWAKLDSRIKIIKKENGGISDARNAGISNATGDYVCFLDGDDWLNELYLERMSEYISPDCLIDCVLGRVLEYREEDGCTYELGLTFNSEVNSFLNTNLSGQQVFLELLKRYGCFPIRMDVRGAYRKRFLDSNCIRFWGRRYEDYDFTMKVIRNAKSLRINPYPFYVWRNRINSASKEIEISNVQDYIDLLLQWKKWINEYQKKSMTKYLNREIGNRFALIFYLYSRDLSKNQILHFNYLYKKNISLLKYADIKKFFKLKLSIRIIGVYNTIVLHRFSGSIKKNFS